MNYGAYVSLKSKPGHRGIIAHDFWGMIFKYKLNQATDFEIRLWPDEFEGLEVAKKYGHQVENSMSEEYVYSGKVSEAFRGEVCEDYLNKEGNIKWFTIHLKSGAETIFTSETNGSELCITTINKVEKYDFKTLMESSDLLKRFPEIDFFHIYGQKDEWHVLQNDEDIKNLLEAFGDFHDSCLKELHYVSNAYVDHDLSMYPSNYSGHVSIIFHRQVDEIGTLELQFTEGIQMNINASNPNKEGLLLDAFIGYIDGLIYWAASKEWSPNLTNKNDVSWFAAKKVRWRILEDCLGGEPPIYRMDI